MIRTYTATAGRTRATRYDPVTLVATRAAVEAHDRGLGMEHREILAMCRHRAVAVAELAARLSLPLNAVRILVEDLDRSGRVAVTAPVTVHERRTSAPRLDRAMLAQLRDGLLRL